MANVGGVRRVLAMGAFDAVSRPHAGTHAALLGRLTRPLLTGQGPARNHHVGLFGFASSAFVADFDSAHR